MRNKAIGALALVVAVTAASCGGGGSADATHEDPSLVHQRVWIEKIPTKPNELVHVFGVLEDDEPLGFFAQVSRFKLILELCEQERIANELKLRFPQDERKAKMKFKIEKCDEVRDADLCLLVDQNPWGGPKKYYGMRVDRARELLPSIARVTDDMTR